MSYSGAITFNICDPSTGLLQNQKFLWKCKTELFGYSTRVEAVSPQLCQKIQNYLSPTVCFTFVVNFFQVAGECVELWDDHVILEGFANQKYIHRYTTAINTKIQWNFHVANLSKFHPFSLIGLTEILAFLGKL